MKSKQSFRKQITSLKFIGETNIQKNGEEESRNEKVLKQLSKIDLTISSLSQNQISTASLLSKQAESQQNEESDQKQSFMNKNMKKSNKKKIIQKNIILRSRDRNGKSSRIMKKKQEQKRKRLQRKAQKLKQKIKKQKLKQKYRQKKHQSSLQTPKPSKPVKIVETCVHASLDDFAQIRQLGFDRKQLQKKRDDLMKRLVDDWSWLEKSRSEKRQLRTCNN